MSSFPSAPDRPTPAPGASLSGTGLALDAAAHSPALGRVPVWVDRLIPYLSIARPDHWFKNVFMMAGVLLAYFCYPDLVDLGTFFQFVVGLASVCLLASSNYVINEILDAPTDRSHPVKRHRPIPSGRVLLPIAYAEWILLGAVGLA